MKKARKIAAFVAAMAMVATMAVPSAMVASAATGSNTIKVDSGTFKHTSVSAYQLFAGTATAQTAGEASLNISGWGDGINAAAFYAALKADATVGDDFSDLDIADSDITNTASAVKVAEKIAEYGNKSAEANAIAKVALDCLDGEGSGSYDSTTQQITELADGYYIVVDGGSDVATRSLAMLKVSSAGDNVTVTTKEGKPTFTKKINDVNDSTNSLAEETDKYEKHDGWNTDADYDMGDNVPFLLTATLPSDIANYSAYGMIFHDDLQDEVFDLNEDSIKLYYGASFDTAVEMKAGFTVFVASNTVTLSEEFSPEEGTTDGHEDFEVVIKDLKELKDENGDGIEIANSNSFYVAYDAELTTDANIGSAGNWNGGKLEYSNNPNATGSGIYAPGETPSTPTTPTPTTPSTEKSQEEYVVAFTYQTSFTKIDAQTLETLKGAKFKLYKKDLNADADAEKYGVDGTYKDYVLVGEGESDEYGNFGWQGIDDGNYLLVETKAPSDAYKSTALIPFEIKAGHEETELKSLNDKDFGEVIIDGFVLVQSNTQTSQTEVNAGKAYVDKEEGKLSASITNSKETTLPTTGGMGTTLFYTAGGMLVIGAGIYLISKKRAKDEE